MALELGGVEFVGLDELAPGGIIITIHGRGTFVADRPEA
jgi:DNA-binding GntR family transcriptional regulator